MNIKKNDIYLSLSTNTTITGSIIEDPTMFNLAITGSIIEDPTMFNLADGATVKMIPNPPTNRRRKSK